MPRQSVDNDQSSQLFQGGTEEVNDNGNGKGEGEGVSEDNVANEGHGNGGGNSNYEAEDGVPEASLLEEVSFFLISCRCSYLFV